VHSGEQRAALGRAREKTMDRRDFVLLVPMSVALPLRAQPAGRVARVGILSGLAPGAEALRFYDPIRQRLVELGHVEGRNLEIEYRFAEGRFERFPALAGELLARKSDVLVGIGPAATFAAVATKSVPVVALAVNDPVVMGLAQTMARPGGNVTGVSSWGIELVAKRLQLLKELLPAVRRFGILSNPGAGEFSPASLARFESDLGLAIVVVYAGAPTEFDTAFATLARERVGGLTVTADPMFYVHRARIAQLCIQGRLPSVWGGRDYLEGGGLASYQSDFVEVFRRGADQIDKILRGGKPGEIPFQQATKLVLVVNLKAARALGITMPASMLASADEVIE
jgi:putative ABC transport system substrate-binding protein